MTWGKTSNLWVLTTLLLTLGMSPLAAQDETVGTDGIEMQFDELEKRLTMWLRSTCGASRWSKARNC